MDGVYENLLRPAATQGGFELYRLTSIHGSDLEAVLLAGHLIVDLSLAAPDAYYALGVRHALRWRETTVIAAEGTRVEGDGFGWPVLRYELGASGVPASDGSLVGSLAKAMTRSDGGASDRALVDLLDAPPPAPIERLKTDAFRDLVVYAVEVKEQLADARRTMKLESVAAVRAGLITTHGSVAAVSTAVLVDLLLSFRAVRGWSEMVALCDEMPTHLEATTLVREQRALALNRMGHGEDAERILRAIIAERGPSSESCGLLGRVLKDRWADARGTPSSSAYLHRAIEAYTLGFESDWRDAYPGINALTLMEIAGVPDRGRLLPVVRYAAARRIASGREDYWDFATMLELAIIGGDEAGAREALKRALSLVREPWEPESTARNLELLEESRRSRGEAISWTAEIISALEGAA
ncbi:MAG: TRAFs-binding domain-containing protein [Deltaproteobacteria bacterium]